MDNNPCIVKYIVMGIRHYVMVCKYYGERIITASSHLSNNVVLDASIKLLVVFFSTG